ncbi:ABC transporter ATP-binding protein [Luteitalea sp.]|jgi:ABC-type polysaccharide/polyol phosphate transport system ATPase subunit|uniref:ABC transporter ATP-binding protein n=1 Tax=Luteitalea sp. TaxID=2004800 RepID=UPI0037C533B2
MSSSTPALAIRADNVTKIYRRFAHKRQFATLKSAILTGSLVRDLSPDETFRALDGVSFDVQAGRTYGIIGRNGSGKSTMLKCVAGIAKPTMGKVTVNGRISALIELGAGFHPEISGRENVFINGIMLGLSKAEIERRFDEIVEFAELAPFIDAPVKTYSSGMYMRLGFAVAVHVDPDVLLVDEVLAVGDEGFAHKCLDKFAEFRRRGKTILLVTHSLGLVERFCDEALWLDKGKVRAVGDPKRVIDAYVTEVEESEEAFLASQDAKARERVDLGAGSSVPAHEAGVVEDGVTAGDVEAPADMFKAEAGRWGSGDIEIASVELIGADGLPGHVFHSGEAMTIRLHLKAKAPVKDFVFGIGLFNADGVCIYGTNTNIEEMSAQEFAGEGRADFVIEDLALTEGTYKLDLAVHKLDGFPYDYHRQLYTFRVKSPIKDVGFFRPRHSWRFSPSVRLKQLQGPEGWRPHMKDDDAAG